VKWVISPQIARIKINKTLARRISLKARRIFFKKYNKKKNGKACYVEWDSYAVSDSNSDDDDEGDEKPSKKSLVGIAIKEAPSLFDIPYCLMEKDEPKVSDVDEFTYDDLVEMISNLDNLLGNMKGRYKDLKKNMLLFKNLMRS
jgi:hypothetical protein